MHSGCCGQPCSLTMVSTAKPSGPFLYFFHLNWFLFLRCHSLSFHTTEVTAFHVTTIGWRHVCHTIARSSSEMSHTIKEGTQAMSVPSSCF